MGRADPRTVRDHGGGDGPPGAPGCDRGGQHTTLLDALFTATSAASTTGLVLSDTATHWSPFGQVVILGLMQIGGFAFMTGSTIFLLLLVGRRTSLSDRLRVQAAGGVPQLGKVTDLVRRVALFTLICEAAGALVLAAAFLLRGEDPATAAWWGLFHSVSAFNNGGFDLFGELQSLTQLADAPTILVPMGTLIVLGGLGYAIVGRRLGEAALGPARARDEACAPRDGDPDRGRRPRARPCSSGRTH